MHDHGDGVRHVHLHAHDQGRRDRHEHPHPAAPVIVGGLHGLAGSAALTLASLETMRSSAEALAYLAIFSAGTLLGMVLLTMALFLPIHSSAARVTITVM